MTAASPIAHRNMPAPAVIVLGGWRLQRKHILMLALAVGVLCMGVRRAEFYSPPGISVDLPSAHGHVIT